MRKKNRQEQERIKKMDEKTVYRIALYNLALEVALMSKLGDSDAAIKWVLSECLLQAEFMSDESNCLGQTRADFVASVQMRMER
jgi:hypothetical protein